MPLIQRPLRFFLSSTSIDLEPIRKEIIRFLQVLPADLLAMEFFGSDEARPKEYCLDQVGRTPISCRSSHLASFPSLGGTAAAPWASFPQPEDATAAGQGLLTGLPTPDSLAEATGPPRFLENPTMNVPCSSTPARPQRSATATL